MEIKKGHKCIEVTDWVRHSFLKHRFDSDWMLSCTYKVVGYSLHVPAKFSCFCWLLTNCKLCKELVAIFNITGTAQNFLQLFQCILAWEVPCGFTINENTLFLSCIQYKALNSQLQFVVERYFCIYEDCPCLVFSVTFKIPLPGHWFEKDSGRECTDPASIQPLLWLDHCQWQPGQSLREAADCHRETEAGAPVGPNQLGLLRSLKRSSSRPQQIPSRDAV